MELNNFGLTNEIASLIKWRKEEREAQRIFDDAQTRLAKVRASIKSVRVRLGNHTKASGLSAAVHIRDLPGFVVLIPVPPAGYTDYEVTEQVVPLTKVGEFVE